MTMLFVELGLMLAIILIASELFTNALEHLGERLGISEGVTGSLFAAVGTALPETTVPIIALLSGFHVAMIAGSACYLVAAVASTGLPKST